MGEAFEEIFAEYRRSREQFQEMQAKLRKVKASATSPNGMVTVTVGQQGEITDLAFNNRRYRDMHPKELGAAVLNTVGEARKAVTAQLQEILEPNAPAGMSLNDVFSGEVGLDAMLPADLLSLDGSSRSSPAGKSPSHRSREAHPADDDGWSRR
ncbi:YbaB/EbfC family nucleoid-associated protein [Streptomyces sp. 8N616]|uniref:YbaB/EbfC family nucleoid-associated protein n=1 Tax=Streptomyces sp. 8N616 TaxID=3457414 RepID=UPI003FD52B8F